MVNIFVSIEMKTQKTGKSKIEDATEKKNDAF